MSQILSTFTSNKDYQVSHSGGGGGDEVRLAGFHPIDTGQRFYTEFLRSLMI